MKVLNPGEFTEACMASELEDGARTGLILWPSEDMDESSGGGNFGDATMLADVDEDEYGVYEDDLDVDEFDDDEDGLGDEFDEDFDDDSDFDDDFS
jgi:hypothetical protein